MGECFFWYRPTRVVPDEMPLNGCVCVCVCVCVCCLLTNGVMLQMENLIARMQAEHTGVQVRTVKSFISKIPSVFTGMTQYACFSETILSIDVKKRWRKKN